MAVVGAASAASPSAEETLSAARRAAGGDAWESIRTLHAVGKIEAGGLSGPWDSWTDAATGRYADRFDLGPASFAQGFDGKSAWSADTSGQARVDDSPDARQESADEAYRRSASYWVAGRRPGAIEDAGSRTDGKRTFRVVRVTPEGGRPFEMWIDSSTFLIDRLVEAGATATTTTFFSDYRPVSGALLPYEVRVSTGEAKYDARIAVAKIEANAVAAAAAFDVPPPPPPDFSIAGGATSTTIPFELAGGHIAIEAKINGHAPHRIFCDTGGSNVITPSVAKELGAAATGALEGAGTGERSVDVGLARVDTIEIGAATIRNQMFAVFDLSPLEPVDGGAIPGLVGYEVFKRFVVTIDYERRRLTLTLPSAFRYRGRGTSIPIEFHGTKAQVRGSLDGIPGAFDIDTGSRASLDVTRPFAEEHGLAERYGAKHETITGWGVGGPSRSLLARAGKLELGGIEIPRVVALLSLQAKGAFADSSLAGNVGAGILRRFTVTFDYPGKRIILEKNAAFGEPDTYDRGGLWVNAAPEAFEVVDVVAGGPADSAGLRPGDRIVSVEGKPAVPAGLSGFRRRMATDPPGSSVTLHVLPKDGASREVTIVLRDLV
jgi:hypothetical protein